jgi:hypothetical protein
MALAQDTDVKKTSPLIRGSRAGETRIVVIPDDRELSPEKRWLSALLPKTMQI